MRPEIVTAHPSRTSQRAHARPMPLPPPVMNAACPPSGQGDVTRHLIANAFGGDATPAGKFNGADVKKHS